MLIAETLPDNQSLGIAHEMRWCKVASAGPTTLFDMLKQYAFGFYEVIVRLETLRNDADFWVKHNDNRRTPDYQLEDLSKSLSDMRTECESIGMVSTSDLISHIESEVHRLGQKYSCNEMLNHLNSLNFSFNNELQKRFFFRIDDNKKENFQQDDLFGPEVSNAFPSCVDEVRNSGSCFALEQYDACVFHLMRTLERGLNALAVKFGMPFQHTNWHNVIEQVELKIRKIDKSFGPDWKEQQKFCSQAASQFMFLKDARRNHVMHGRDIYDEGRALSILSNVRGFMHALAKGGLHE